MKRNLFLLGILFILGVVALFTNIIWLFVVPAVLLAVVFMLPDKEVIQVGTDDEMDEEGIIDEEVDEEARLMAEYEALQEEKRKLMTNDDEDEDDFIFDDDDELIVEPVVTQQTEPTIVQQAEPVQVEPVVTQQAAPAIEQPITEEIDIDDLVIEDLEEVVSDGTEQPLVVETVEQVQTVPPQAEKPTASKKDDLDVLLEELL